jgi:hypothetical protein
MTKKGEFKNYEELPDHYDWTMALDHLNQFGPDIDQVKIIIHHFCYCIENNQPVPSGILNYLKDSFAEFLFDKKSLEAALKIKGLKGRPRRVAPDSGLSPGYLLTLADLIIKEGKNKENAVYDTAQISNEGRPEKEHVGIQTIRDNFEIYKLDVLTTFLMTKEYFEEDINEAEIAQIRKYFDPAFSPKN